VAGHERYPYTLSARGEIVHGDTYVLVVSEPDPKVDQLARSVIGAAIEVHRHLGPGFTEDVYEKALRIELALRDIPFETQKTVGVDYKGHGVGVGRLDLLVGGCLVVELKAARAVTAVDEAKVLSYLKATGRTLALLINFNVPLLKDGLKRLVRSPTA
jgi:GxxExxY protein